MKKSVWIFKTEFLQNKIFFSLTFLASLLLGSCLIQGKFALEKIESLTVHERWNADVIVLPKGLNVADLKQEIISGKPTRFLPSALYDSTKALIKDRFLLSMILPVTVGTQSQVLQQGDKIGLSWLDPSIPVVPWREQITFQNQEWGTQVAAALLASGPPDVMKSFQELIDRKTIGQAFIVHDELVKNEVQHANMFFYLRVISILILFLFLSIIFLLIHLLKQRLKNVYQILHTHGFAKSIRFSLVLILGLCFVAIPFATGLLVSSFFNPFI